MSDNADIEQANKEDRAEAGAQLVNMSLENNHQTSSDNGGCSEHQHLLVLDGTPQWLHHILQSLDNPSTIIADAFISAIYILVYESGFTVEGGPKNPGLTYNINVMREISDYSFLKRIDSSYKFVMSLGTETDTNCILVAIPVHNIMIVNFLMSDSKMISLSFNVNDYVRLNNDDAEICNGRELSIKFHSALCEVRQRLLNEPLSDPKHLLALPTEILLDICNYLTPSAYFYFSLSCKHIYYTVYNDESVWSKIGRLFLPCRKRANESWKEFIIYQLKKKQEEQERLNRPPYFPDLIDWPYLVSI